MSRGLATRQPTPSQPFPAVVTRSDAAGVFVVRIGGDGRPSGLNANPLGPCKGASRLAAGGLSVERLPLQTEVLALFTERGLWILAHDREVT